MGSFEACGAAAGKRQTSVISASTLDGQVGWFFPAALLAFDRHRSGALEDVTGASHPSGEPLVFGTPWTVPVSFEASAHGPGPSRPGPVGTGVLTG